MVEMEVKKIIEIAIKLSIDKSSQALSKILKSGSKIELLNIKTMRIKDINSTLPIDLEVAGAYIDLDGEREGFKLLFLVELTTSFRLAELMLRWPNGKIKEYNTFTESAIAEIGNILGSTVSNVFSSDFGIKIIPTPPHVVRDFSSNLLEYMIMDIPYIDCFLFAESRFFVVKEELPCYFFILPKGDIFKCAYD